MKKIISTIFLLFFSTSFSFGATLQEASEYFNLRAVSPQGFDNARMAAKLGEEIGLNSQNVPNEAALGFLISCKSYYFLGDYLPEPRSVTKSLYESGYKNCKKGISLIELSKGKAKKEEWNDLLADLYFVYTTNFGRWFEDEGKLDALKYWKNEVKPLLELLAGEMDKVEIFGHGPLRGLGRAWFSIPGGRTKAFKYLKDAYEGSLHPTLGVSIYPLNTAFYAEALIARGDKKEAKEILEDALKIASDSSNLKELNEESFRVYGEYRYAEMLEEINLCQEIYNGL